MTSLEPFLTAYDPSDLPGFSVDPLGFDRGYTLLADKILPGLTNVASRPRYFSSLCGAIAVSDARRRDSNETPRACLERRRDAVLRLERFWALACMLASRRKPELTPQGIRGIRYVQRALDAIDDDGDRSTTANYTLLSRQMTYGMVGIYGSVADQLGFIDRGLLQLGPDFGQRLATAYVEGTSMPAVLKNAIANDGSVSLATLAQWGEAAHINAEPSPAEVVVFREALEANDTRRRMAILLNQHRAQDDEPEIARLRRVLQAIAGSDRDVDLRESLRAIVAFEECFRLVSLVFLRMLWFCQAKEPFEIAVTAAGDDLTVRNVFERLRHAVGDLESALDQGETPAFVAHLDRMKDIRAFLGGAAACEKPTALVEAILLRHRDVQGGKFEGGRRKSPWIEVREGRITPTFTTATNVRRAPETVDDVVAHPFRTGAADRFVDAGGLA